MAVAPQDRPLAALREETVDQLIVNYGRARLSLEAFERRLDRALEATRHDELLALTADLETFEEAELPATDFAERKREALGVTRDRSTPQTCENIINILGGTKRSGTWSVPAEIRIFSFLGGATLDFSEASFTATTTRIRAFSLLGGTDIYVPENVNTVSKAFCLLGGVDDSAGLSNDPAAPTIVIEGLVVLGGVKVRLKRGLRERLLAFAQSVRAMFSSAQ
jgi:DUF1707 SHOCT-like domain